MQRALVLSASTCLMLRLMFSQLPQYLAEQKELLAEYTEFEGKDQSKKEALAAKKSREAELKRTSAERKRKSVELKHQGAKAGGQKRERPEEGRLEKKRQRGGVELPDEEGVLDFLRGEKGWGYKGKGWEVQGPDEGSRPMETCEVS